MLLIQWHSVPLYPPMNVGHQMVGFPGCCGRAASGHAAAAPLSATSNSRRLMVTVIRPSRARCVKGIIPRHERAVLPFKEGRMLVASTSVFGFKLHYSRGQLLTNAAIAASRSDRSSAGSIWP